MSNLIKNFTLYFPLNDNKDINQKHLFELIFLFNDETPQQLFGFKCFNYEFNIVDNEQIFSLSLEFFEQDKFDNFTDADIDHLASIIFDTPDISESNFKNLGIKIHEYVLERDLKNNPTSKISTIKF